MAAPSAAILAAIQGGTEVWLHELDLPDSTTLRSCTAGFSDASGHYDARVLAWGAIEEGYDPAGDGVAVPETWVELADDEDDTLALLIRGRYRDNFERGVAYRVKVAAPGVDSSDWWTAFAGVTTRPEQTGAKRIKFSARVDDRAIRTVAPRRMVAPTWPLTEADARDLPAPVIYGIHDGGALGLTRGQVPTVYADELLDVRLVSGGACLSIVRAYDDAGLIAASGYDVTIEERKGWTWHVLTMDSAPDGPVTVDVQGIEEDGDGGGALITDAAEQLAHYLSNFCFGQASGTTWLSTSSRIDSTTLAAATTWLEARYYGSDGVSYYRGEAVEGYTVLREWEQSTGLRVWWRADGTLAFVVPIDDADPYFDTVVYRWAQHDTAGTWAPRSEDRDLCTGLRLKHVPCSTDGGYLSTLELRDPLATDDEVEELPMPWSRAS